MKRVYLNTLLLICLLGTILFGCQNLRSAPLTMTKYAIDYPREPFEHLKKLPAVICVDRFGAAPGYASTKMIYADHRLNRSSFTYHYWFAPPSQMVASALYKDLKYAQIFRAATLPQDPVDAGYVISGSVTDFYQENDAGSWYAVLEITVLGFKKERMTPVQDFFLEKQYRTKIACKDKDAQTFAESMSRAVSILSRQIILDVYAKIAVDIQ